MEDVSEIEEFLQKFKNKLVQNIITTNYPKRFGDMGIHKSRKAAISESSFEKNIFFTVFLNRENNIIIDYKHGIKVKNKLLNAMCRIWVTGT